MKKFLILCIFVIAGSLFAENPDQVIDNMVDAVYSGNSQGLLDGLSSESIAMIDMVIMMMKTQPEEVAADLSEETGLDITVDDVLSWSVTDFIDAFILSPGFVAELPPRGAIDVSGYEIEGETAVVFVDFEGEEETIEIDMMKSGDSWKIAQSFLDSGVL